MRRLAIALAMLAILPIAAKADELSDMKAALSAAMGSIHALQERVRVLEQEKDTTAAIKPARKPRAAAPIVVSRDSPDELRTTTNFCVFPALGQAGLAAWPAVVTVDAPNGGRGADLAIFANIWTHSSLRSPLNA